jgi:hypothetical protein
VEYLDSDVVGVEENSLLLYYWDGTAWVDAATTCQSPPGYTLDTEANVFSTGICHLNQFALMGESQPRIFLPMLIQNP